MWPTLLQKKQRLVSTVLTPGVLTGDFDKNARVCGFKRCVPAGPFRQASLVSGVFSLVPGVVPDFFLVDKGGALGLVLPGDPFLCFCRVNSFERKSKVRRLVVLMSL